MATALRATEAASHPLISFFVPCLNEELNIIGALDTIIAALEEAPVPAEILVVDDCSSDGTVRTVEQYISAHPTAPIVLLRHAEHQGLGHNYGEAANIASGQYYMLVNGDNVERKEVIVAVLSRLGQADIVIPFFGTLDERPLQRRFVSRAFTILVNLLSGNRMGYYNGAVAHLRDNVLQHYRGTRGFGYQAELITRLVSLGATYVEVEVPSEERRHGKSSAFEWRNFMSVSGSLWRIWLNHLHTRPGQRP